MRPATSEIVWASEVGEENIGSGSVAGRIITNQDHRRLVILIRDRESQRLSIKPWHFHSPPEDKPSSFMSLAINQSPPRNTALERIAHVT